MTLRPALVLALLLGLAGCGSAPTRPEAAPPAAAVHATAHDNLNATLWMQSSAEYNAALQGAFNLAIAQMERALADPDWDALPPTERAGQPVAGLKPAIIVDADETMIDNTAFQARTILDDEPYSLERWQAWVNERRARALPGALAFARRAQELGVTIFFVTNREHPVEREATRDNLVALGFPIAEDGSNLILQGDPRAPEDDKGTRRKLIGQDHRVLLLIGDNLGDFVDGFRTGMAERQAMVDERASWWGQRWIMLPNPSYGSWESAVRRACGGTDGSACRRSVLRHD